MRVVYTPFFVIFLLCTAVPIFAQSSSAWGSCGFTPTPAEELARSISTIDFVQEYDFTNADVTAVNSSVPGQPEALPEMPVPKAPDQRKLPLVAYERPPSRSPPLRALKYRAQNLPYWALTGAVVGSNIAAIELLQTCLSDGRCTSVPRGMRSRPAMYGVGLGVAAGVSEAGYYFRRKGNRWWFIPGTLAIAFDLVFVKGAAERIR